MNFTEYPVHLDEVCSYFLAQMMDYKTSICKNIQQ